MGLSLVCNDSLRFCIFFFIDCRIAVQAENEFFDSWEGAPTATQAMVAVEEALRTYGIDKVPITTNDVWPSGNFASGEGQVDVYVWPCHMYVLRSLRWRFCFLVTDLTRTREDLTVGTLTLWLNCRTTSSPIWRMSRHGRSCILANSKVTVLNLFKIQWLMSLFHQVEHSIHGVALATICVQGWLDLNGRMYVCVWIRLEARYPYACMIGILQGECWFRCNCDEPLHALWRYELGVCTIWLLKNPSCIEGFLTETSLILGCTPLTTMVQYVLITRDSREVF